MQNENTVFTLADAQLDTEYYISEVSTNDKELESFLFTLGCYPGEKATVLSRLSQNYIVTIKDARYSIDKELAKAIVLKPEE